MHHLVFSSKAFDKIPVDCAVVTAFSNHIPLTGNAALLDWRLNGRISRLIMDGRFKGGFQEAMLLPSEGRVKPPLIMVFGLGSSGQFNESLIGTFSSILLEKLANQKAKSFLISFTDIFEDRFEWRNAVRLLVSKLHDFPIIEDVHFCETTECIYDVKKRHMDFGMTMDVTFEL
ncbi:MAG: hypothetical protein A3G32_04605 [Deltaproteobacteria bacterium RIFCSPLOWO2_12_FULL_40_28]|nr:MAG: hypothetical protein A3C45_08715 [Deltaproteobacteria bacterium RIFCSPHIGHO2_02_FULL_40_28]OGQ19650.1 MAG: hypothetical protein A3E27_07910 [Deltaproteobacteria bacterium RIFCSPHIGHO2_12_FULL_40_32]OGQ40927.1 MAG: hypothetical protein A3I69_03325 [Deltaproteobacteria bacterium RIFCSPLOWO2_02_FULL_40_36]OGQ54042.1 MAG: hypothetical protein A3G32_04605 [Deltaproteobacteria bacterium RIFCSPLOWO2_12_FULL_40_28]